MKTRSKKEIVPVVTHWQLARDIGVFQVKLIVDGFRDLLLVPASLIAGAVSFFASGERRGEDFYNLLRMGRRSERYINLFGAVERHDTELGIADADGATDARPEDIDRMVERIENFVVSEYRHGHLTGPARERLDAAVQQLRQLRQSARRPMGSGGSTGDGKPKDPT